MTTARYSGDHLDASVEENDDGEFELWWTDYEGGEFCERYATPAPALARLALLIELDQFYFDDESGLTASHAVVADRWNILGALTAQLAFDESAVSR